MHANPMKNINGQSQYLILIHSQIFFFFFFFFKNKINNYKSTTTRSGRKRIMFMSGLPKPVPWPSLNCCFWLLLNLLRTCYQGSFSVSHHVYFVEKYDQWGHGQLSIFVSLCDLDQLHSGQLWFTAIDLIQLCIIHVSDSG